MAVTATLSATGATVEDAMSRLLPQQGPAVTVPAFDWSGAITGETLAAFIARALPGYPSGPNGPLSLSAVRRADGGWDDLPAEPGA